MLGIYILGSNDDNQKIYKFEDKDIRWNRYIERYEDIHNAITEFSNIISKLSYSNLWMIAVPHNKETTVKRFMAYSYEVKYIPNKKTDFVILAEYHYDKKTSATNITNKKGGIDISLSFRNDNISLLRDGYKQTFNKNILAFQYIYDNIYKTGVNAKVLVNDKEFTDISKMQNDNLAQPVSFIIENPSIIEYRKNK